MLTNGLHNVAGLVIRTILSLLIIPILIRYIGIENYGLWTLVSTSIGLLSVIESGLSVSTTVFVARDRANDDPLGLAQTLTTTIGGMLIFASAITLTLWISAPLIVDLFSKLDTAQRIVATQALQVSGIVIWTRLLQQILVGIEQAYQKFGTINIVTSAFAVFNALGTLFVVGSGGGVVALMELQAVLTLASLVIHSLIVRSILHHLKLRPTWERSKSLKIARYNGVTWLTSLGTVIFGQCDRLIVGAMLGTETLGIYAVITNISTQINSISGVAVIPLLASVGSHSVGYQTSHSDALQKDVTKALAVNGAIAIGLGVMIIGFAKEILHFVLATPSTAYVPYLQVTAFIYAIYSLNGVGYLVLYGIGAIVENLVIVLLSSLLSITMIWLLGMQFGLFGALLGNAGYIATLFLTPLAAKKIHIPMRTILEKLWLPYVVLGFSAASAFLLQGHLVLNILLTLAGLSLILYWFVQVYEIELRQVWVQFKFLAK